MNNLAFSKLIKTDKFIELIRYTLSLFGIYNIEKIKFHLDNKDRTKRFKLKYNGICGCEIDFNKGKEIDEFKGNNLVTYTTDIIFSEIYKLLDTNSYEELIEYINNINFKCKKSNNKRNIIDHIICHECNKTRRNNILDIQEELLDKRMYILNDSKRYHYCKGQDKSNGKFSNCCNLDDTNCEQIYIGPIVFNIQPIENFVLTHSSTHWISSWPRVCVKCNTKEWNIRYNDNNNSEIEDEINEIINEEDIIKDKHEVKKYEMIINGKSFSISQSKYRRFWGIQNCKDIKNGKCLHCDNNDWRLFEFDHIKGDKLFNIAGSSTYDKEKVKEEADKTQLLCRVCHRIKTSKTTSPNHNKHLKSFWYKEGYSIHELIKFFGTCNNQGIKRYIINKLKENGCKNCGCKKYIHNYPEIYEYNHVNPRPHLQIYHHKNPLKVCHISIMKYCPKYSVLDVYNEILKCEVLCGNCHKLHTLKQNNSIFYEIKNKDDFLKLEKPQYRPKETKYNEKYIISMKNYIRVSMRNEKMKKKHGKYPRKEFYFKNYENEETALEAAIKYRNELLS